MYIRERGRLGKKRQRRRKSWKLGIGAALFFIITLGVYTFMEIVVFASPENPEVEAEAQAQKEAKSGDVSGNELTPEPEQYPKEKKSIVPLVVVDAGHGGLDVGCMEKDVSEKDINLQIAQRVKGRLEDMGFQVLLVREKDEYLAKEDRVEIANRFEADAYVSIHQNTYEGSDKSVGGIETWYDGTDIGRDSERLARLVHQETIKSTGAVERELWDIADFCVTNKTQMPACLIETGFLSNPQERALLTSPEYQEKVAQGIAEGIHLFFQPKTMYLTFDDGPSELCTDMVLDVLKANDVKATFFLIGEYVEKYPEVAKRIAEEGHTIGIHCYKHDYGALYESKESYLADFQKAYDVILETTGVEARLFRFPGGSVNPYNEDVCEEIVHEMTKKGFIYFDWNASLNDAVGNYEPEQLITNARETTLDRKKVVMLAHDRVLNTALCLEELLRQFPEYRMKPLNEHVKPVQFNLPDGK
ncbi:N-acetylmuramoyl-L-alanine amidase [Parablautia muri]|nr:N-acetylmuramoyl-L-alanine amidase [Parablautia muri]